MGRITGGEISYSETRKIADYENKSAKVTLSFGFDDGEDYDTVMSEIQANAKHRVQVMLGFAKAATADIPQPKSTKAVVEEPAEAVEPPTSTPAAWRSAPREQPVAEELPLEDEEPAEEVDEVEADDIADDLADLEGEDATPEITDADLTKAIALRKEKLGEDGGVKIRKLILKFAPKIPAIPQDKRAVFLESLKALK